EMLIKKLDSPTLQVLLETQIVEVTLTDTFRFGISWLWKDFTTEHSEGALEGTMRFDDRTGTTDEAIRSTALYYTQDYTGPYKFLFRNDNVAALLQLTKSVSDVDMVSNPKIVTANHIKAHIFVGEKIPFAHGLGYGQYTLKWEEIGVKLSVTPHINEKGETSLEVKTEVSELGINYETILGTTPSVLTREAETKVNVPNGQTLVIGGMMQNKVTDTRSGIPGLMRIPVLKYLFSSKSKVTRKVEYIFFLTPHIVMGGREIRPEEIPEMKEATPSESSPPAEVIKIEPIKEKEKSNKQRKKN
ncbi:hypothetical protein L6386_04090, partial [bacterium]|nr:hypothetical protein [bacterium]MCG2677718.1 hypothetical protein [bacterium]